MFESIFLTHYVTIKQVNDSLKKNIVTSGSGIENRKWWKDKKRFSFLSIYMFDWRDEKLEGWKTFLFSWVDQWKNKRCSLYKFILMLSVHNI